MIDISRDKASQQLFEKITEMCFSRILTRLRSKHATKVWRTKKKPAMMSLLLDTVSHCKSQASFSVVVDVVRAKRVTDQCEELRSAFEKLETCELEERSLQVRALRDLLSLAHQFDVQYLATILSHSTGSVREYLPRAVEKLGRYRAIAAGLANASRTREHSLFQHIMVKPIANPGLHVGHLNLKDTLQDFESI